MRTVPLDISTLWHVHQHCPGWLNMSNVLQVQCNSLCSLSAGAVTMVWLAAVLQLLPGESTPMEGTQHHLMLSSRLKSV